LVGGDEADTGKRAAVSWTQYQQQKPTAEALRMWFEDPARSAYGVVCGAVSGLLVVDLDEAETEVAFAQAFPQVQATFRVRSGLRGTSHFYFHIDFPINTQKLRGGDLKAEGSYVVGPGSRIAGGQWVIVNDSLPLSFSKIDVEQLLSVLAVPSTASAEPSQHDPPVGAGTDGDFAARYRRAALHSGQRNTTLFNVARAMRDQGYSQQRAVTLLAEGHALQAPLVGQR
jgi:hypothetical protein